MRKAALPLLISMMSATAALAQSDPARDSVPIPAPRPLPSAPLPQGPGGIAYVSQSAAPTYDQNTYSRVREAMLSYAGIEVRGGWPAIPKAARLGPGATGADVRLLRRRLAITDDLPPEKIESDVYDADLTRAVQRFQARHGLPETGSVGPQTLAALNVPVGRRLRQLAATLDRMAELNFTFGQRHVVVNIPAAVAEAVEDDNVKHRYVVVVGKIDRPSPTLTTSITAINLNPTWTAPLSIVKKDIVPRMRRDPGYLARMNMRVLDGQGNELDPRSIDWRSDRSPNFTVRQDSGANNALGALRIDMPNPHAVYMHDTNTRKLFTADYRFHSSGCARVAEVRDLAVWLLDDRNWSRASLDAAIAKGSRHDIRLKHRVPVAWVYFTGWVTRDDVVHFRDDVYQYDDAPTVVAQAPRPPVQTAARASGFVLQSAETVPVIRHEPYLDSR